MLFNNYIDNSKIELRDCEFKIIDVPTAIKFTHLFHSVLPKIDITNIYRNTHYICFGLYYKENLIATAIVTSPIALNRFKDKNILEIRRLTFNNAPYNLGSFFLSKIIKFIKKYFKNIKKIITYQAINEHFGTIYKASNFKAIKKIKFVDWNNIKRKRNQAQTKSDKIRWEYELIKE